MSKRTIVAMPGDGIGRVVLEETIRVLSAAGFEADYVEGDIGWDFWCREGDPLPQRTINLIEEHKIGLFGAITSKPKDEAFDELSPTLKDKGTGICQSNRTTATTFRIRYLYAPMSFLQRQSTKLYSTR